MQSAELSHMSFMEKLKNGLKDSTGWDFQFLVILFLFFKPFDSAEIWFGK